MIRFYFRTLKEAEDTLARAIDVARNRPYQYATTEDFKNPGDFGYAGIRRLYSGCGWTLDALYKSPIVRCASGYAIELPRPIPVENFTNIDTESASTEPIFITIHANELDTYDPDEIISSVIEHANEIKDRTVNITIM